MILSHFSGTNFRLNRKRIYPILTTSNMKPRGFWLSDESEFGWREWCEGERFRTEALQHRIDFVCDTSRWIHLKTCNDILDFNQAYRPADKDDALGFYLDWEAVKLKYAGILITPYQWKVRLHQGLLWYYGWDCASACVWDLSTIKRLPNGRPKYVRELSVDESSKVSVRSSAQSFVTENGKVLARRKGISVDPSNGMVLGVSADGLNG